MSVIFIILVKKRLIAELLTEFSAGTRGIQAIVIHPIFRAKPHDISLYAQL